MTSYLFPWTSGHGAYRFTWRITRRRASVVALWWLV